MRELYTMYEKLLSSTVIFHQWLCSLERLQKENEEAKAKEKLLQLSLLRRKFRLWQKETQRVLKIKPMVLQRQQQFCLLWVFV